VRVVFVHIVAETTLSYSHAIASLGSVLSEHGHQVGLATIRDRDHARAAVEILERAPQIVLFSCMSNQWDAAREIASELRRQDSTVKTVVGGSHLSAAPESSRQSPFDVAVIGEGENVIADVVVELCNRRQDGTHVRPGPVVEILDELPLPRLDLFPLEDILAYPSVMFSRGCPYRCTYCMSRLGGIGGKVRWKSPQRAIDEVCDLVAFADPPAVYIDDDTFLKNPKWVREFCDLYRARVDRPFFCNARPETIKRPLVEQLREAGCAAIGIGIESGSERIRREILQRSMTDEKIADAFDMAHAAGLKTWSFNMVGIPTETAADLQATIDLNDRVATDYVRVSIFTPYPGTPFFSGADASTGYFRPAADLPEGLRDLYSGWLRDLEMHGRLWFTEVEAQLIGDATWRRVANEQGAALP
jgi:radical SAM superfamily enzyme YgiQ (UPF0313 family)